MVRLASTAIWLLAAAAACSSPHEPLGPLAPRTVRTLGTWDVDRDGAPLGVVRLLEIDDPAGPIRFYRVETAPGQWVGYIDSSGRVFRYVPFATREEFQGIYTMNEGVALLYEVDGGVRLTARLDAAEATSERIR